MVKNDIVVTDKEMDDALIELAKEKEAREFISKNAARKAKEAAEKAANASSDVSKVNTNVFTSNNVDKALTSKNKDKEINMVEDLEPTAADTVKYEKIQKEKEFRKNVNDAIGIASKLQGDIKELKEAICEGPECLKNQVQSKFGELDQKIKHIEEQNQVFICEKCGYSKIPGLSSFCPQCGSVIPSWNDEDGQPVSGWKHWAERNK